MPLLSATDDFVLGLPVAAVLAQRFRLPSVDPAEFAEMIRIQIEKVLPFSAEEVTTDFEVIEQDENEVWSRLWRSEMNTLPRLLLHYSTAVLFRGRSPFMQRSAPAHTLPKEMLSLFILKARRWFTP